jgi:iron complex outermembrane receptor protein
LQGDVYRGDYDQQLSVPTLTPTNYKETLHDSAKGTGWNLLGRWDRALSVSSDLTLQLYYDHFEREEQIFVWQEYDTFDIDFQHRSRFADRHNLIWGLGYRAIQTHTQATARGSADFDSLTTELWSGFVQDEIELIEDQVQLTLGSKFEHNELTGFEYQPNIRLLWQLQEDKVLWAAVSRAVRTPSLGEIHSILYNETLPPMTPPLYAPLPILIVSRGHPDYLSEELLAYELGFRVDPQPSLSLDLALFLNEYDNLRTLESALPRLADDGPYLILDTTFMNKAQGSVYGLELSADWLIREGWRLALAYSLSEADLETEAGSVDTTNAIFEKSLPRHQLSLRSLSNLRPDLDFDVWIRYVDESIMTRYDSSYSLNSIDGYWDLDLRLAWRPSNRVELSLVGQNLLQGSRLEGMQELYTVIQTEVQRGVYGLLKIDF